MADRIAIVTDSTCDLPLPLLAAEGIFMVPLSIFFGDEEFRDGIDLVPEQFYAKLKNSPHFPTTAQPAPGLFMELFQRLEKEGYTQVLCLHISRKFSGTAQSAAVAAKMVPKLKIEIIDSKTCTWALGGLTLYAQRLVREGKKLIEIIEAVQVQIPKTAIYFAMDNLETLERGGRIGKAKALIGKYLGIRPVLAMQGITGELDVLAKTYSAKAATEMMVQYTLDHIRRHGIRQLLGVLQASVSTNGDAAMTLLKQADVDLTHLKYGVIGGVVGSHVGPTAWGIIVC